MERQRRWGREDSRPLRGASRAHVWSGAVAAILLILGPSPRGIAAEAPKPGAAKSSRPRPVDPGLAERTFDTSLGRLPRGFVGHSIEKYIQGLEPAVKGEYETSAEFEKRSKQASSAGVYAFLLDTDSSANVRYTYDADNESYIVQIIPEREVWWGTDRDRSLSALNIKEIVLAASEYVGQNSYGASTTVTRRRSCSYALLPSSWKADTPLTDFRVSASRKEAPVLTASLRVLAVFRASGSPDDRLSGRESTSPTLNKPVEIVKEHEYVRGELLAFWVYSLSDGRILGKHELSPG